MTVTRRITITYEAPDNAVAELFEAEIAWLIERGRDGGCGCCSDTYDITGQAFSSEPVIPSSEPLVEPS